MYRKGVIEEWQSRLALENENDVTLLPHQQKTFSGPIATQNPDKHLMRKTYTIFVHDSVQSKTMRSSDRNVFQSKNDDSGGSSFVRTRQL